MPNFPDVQELNFYAYKGIDFKFSAVYISEETEQPINLTGFTASLIGTDPTTGTEVFTLTSENQGLVIASPGTTGTLNFNMLGTITTDLTIPLVNHKVVIVDPSGSPTVLLRGTIEIRT